jgi:hypothetical protein
MKRFAIVAGVIALTACGSENSGTVETPEGTAEYSASQDGKEGTLTLTGEDGEVKIASGADQNVELPEGFSLYPGSTVVVSSTTSHAEGSGVRVVMSTDASPLQVAEFYRKQARAAGITNLSEATQGSQLNIVGQGDDGTSFTFAAMPGEGATSVTLMINKGF